MLRYETRKCRMIALRLALLENSAVTGMLNVSTRLIHRVWPVINILDGCQMDTKWENIWHRVVFPLSLSLSLHLSPFFILSSLFVTLPSIHSNILIYNAALINATQTRLETSEYRTTGRQSVCVRVCTHARTRAHTHTHTHTHTVACLCPFETEKVRGVRQS